MLRGDVVVELGVEEDAAEGFGFDVCLLSIDNPDAPPTITACRSNTIVIGSAKVTPITTLHHLHVVTSFIRPIDAELDTLRALPSWVGASCSP